MRLGSVKKLVIVLTIFGSILGYAQDTARVESGEIRTDIPPFFFGHHREIILKIKSATGSESEFAQGVCRLSFEVQPDGSLAYSLWIQPHANTALKPSGTVQLGWIPKNRLPFQIGDFSAGPERDFDNLNYAYDGGLLRVKNLDNDPGTGSTIQEYKTDSGFRMFQEIKVKMYKTNPPNESSKTGEVTCAEDQVS